MPISQAGNGRRSGFGPSGSLTSGPPAAVDQPFWIPQTPPRVNGLSPQYSGYGDRSGASGRVRAVSPFGQNTWSRCATTRPAELITVKCRNRDSPAKLVTSPAGSAVSLPSATRLATIGFV